MQQALFEELLPAWKNFDFMEQMNRIGRNARWSACMDPRPSLTCPTEWPTFACELACQCSEQETWGWRPQPVCTQGIRFEQRLLAQVCRVRPRQDSQKRGWRQMPKPVFFAPWDSESCRGLCAERCMGKWFSCTWIQAGTSCVFGYWVDVGGAGLRVL